MLYSLNKTPSDLIPGPRYLGSAAVAFLPLFHEAVPAAWRSYDAVHIWDVR